MSEIVNIPVTVYLTPDGRHTCSSDRPLLRDKDGMGWLVPGEKCPIRRVER